MLAHQLLGAQAVAGDDGLDDAVVVAVRTQDDGIVVPENDAIRCERDVLRLFGEAPHKAAVLSFLIDGAHAHDLATLLDHEGVAVRSGHHCAHPLMQFFGVPATLRASLSFYNTRAEVDAFVDAIARVRKMLG